MKGASLGRAGPGEGAQEPCCCACWLVAYQEHSCHIDKNSNQTKLALNWLTNYTVYIYFTINDKQILQFILIIGMDVSTMGSLMWEKAGNSGWSSDKLVHFPLRYLDMHLNWHLSINRYSTYYAFSWQQNSNYFSLPRWAHVWILGSVGCRWHPILAWSGLRWCTITCGNTVHH